MLRAFGHRVATCCDMLGVVGSNLKMVKFKPTAPNMSQHGGQTHATCCAQQCCDMLRWHVAIVWPGLKVDLEKVDNEKAFREGSFCLFVGIIMNYILRVLTYKSVKHTVIKACNNKIEQGKDNLLFYVWFCSYLGGKKSFIISSFIVHS